MEVNQGNQPIMGILVSWWGSFEQGGETLGDLWAVTAVVNKLLGLQHKVVLASLTRYGEFPVDVRSWRDVQPSEISALVFVCGPVVGSFTEFQSLIQRFAGCKKIAIGVSILPQSSPKHWNPFDVVIARDGLSPSWGDIAPAFDSSKMETPGDISSRPCVGLCLRGQQSEYGKKACLADQANQTAQKLAAKTDLTIQVLDTKLHNDPRRSAQIVEEFRQCRLVITTRMHGGVLALCAGIPALGIDQISGGAKLYAVLSSAGWPYVIRAEESKSVDLEAVISDFLSMPLLVKTSITESRINLIRKAEKALDMLAHQVG